MFWEGEHVRLVLTHRDRKGLAKELVSQCPLVLGRLAVDCHR